MTRRFRAASFAGALMLGAGVGQVAHADLDQQLNAAFDVLVNTTPPSVAITDTRRGVISGGSFVLRNRISNPRVVTFVPPSFRAGCGGLSFFGGSFSFINAAQFQQLLRNIASSALAYAFELAVGAMSEDVLQAMRRFQKVMGAMNRHMGNSCQMAQGIVNDTLSAMNVKDDLEGATNASFTGAMGDWFDAVTNAATAVDTVTAAGEYATDCGKDANIVWCTLKQNNIANAFFAGGDDQLLEAIQTITGTVILANREAHPDGGNVTPKRFIKGSPEAVHAILRGGQMSTMACQDGTGTKECREVAFVNRVLDSGFMARMSDMILDPADGIVTRLRDPFGAGLSTEQLHFLTNAPGGFGAMLRNITVKNPTMARSFGNRAAPIVALQLVEQILTQIEETVQSAIASQDSSYRPQLDKILESSREARMDVLALLQEQHGSLLDLHRHYIDVMLTAPRSPYGNPLAKSLHHLSLNGR